MPPVILNLAVEDSLSEAAARTILLQSGRPFAVQNCYCKHGVAYVKRSISGFNNAAKGIPFFVLTDLDLAECAPALIRDWLPAAPHHNLIFRVAVHEVESWLLADRDAFAKFLGIPRDRIPLDPDAVNDPKALLVSLATKSKKRTIRGSIVPAKGSTAKVGPDYNGPLVWFVKNDWVASRAGKQSPSLERALRMVKSFAPV
jgi:hypothetical protein